MAELLEWIARRLVDEPGAGRVETEEREDAVVYPHHDAPHHGGELAATNAPLVSPPLLRRVKHAVGAGSWGLGAWGLGA